MGIDKTEIKKSIMHDLDLRARNIKSKEDLLKDTMSIYNYIRQFYDISESTLRKWYNEDSKFRNCIDKTKSNDMCVYIQCLTDEKETQQDNI